ncbi:MAG: metallophosphoesterase family protein [Kofleriaceae bacterium]
MIALAACGTNEAGNIAAPTLGDTSHPAEPGSPVDALRDACGTGTPTLAGVVIARQPYLQQVTATSAIIGWVTNGTDEQRVEVTHPDGLPVMTASAGIEAGAVRVRSDESQMWATVSGLQPNTIYCYGVANAEALNARTGFRTAPAADSTAPVKFLVFGDSGGGGSDQYALRDQMFAYPYDLIIHTGDIAYDDGTISEFEDNVFTVYAELFRNIPFFPAAGNHEYNSSSSAAPFRSVFALPDANGEKWYSYDWGPVHFVALDTEADYQTQVDWLDEDLSAQAKPWKVIYMHRPPYSSGEHGSDTGLRTKLAPILEKHHVQLVLSGHDHDYERMVPQNGTSFVVTGGGGRGTRNVGSSEFTALSVEVIHFVFAEVNADEMILHAVDGTGLEFDSMVIPR